MPSFPRLVAAALLAVAVLLPAQASAAPTRSELVKTVNATTGGSDPSPCVTLGAACFFTADDGVHGRELWATDGTSAGTRLVADVRPGADSGLDPEQARLTVAGGALFFAADAGDGRQLFRTDGTTTTAVATPARAVVPLAALDGKLVFRASTDTAEDQLYVADDAGVRRISAAEIRFSSAVASGGVLYLLGDPDGNGATLFRTTGTSLERVDAGVAQDHALTALGGRVYFFGSTDETGAELRSAGPTGPSTIVKELVDGPEGASWGDSEIVVAGGRLFFDAGNAGSGLWRSDGTAAGTENIGGPGVDDLIATGGGVVFTSWDSSNRARLWRTDGTPGSVQQVPAGNDGLRLAGAAGGAAYVVERRSRLLRVPVAAGAEPTVVKAFEDVRSPSFAVAPFGDGIVAGLPDAAVGNEPYVAGPTGAATLLRDLDQVGPGADIRELTTVGDLAYFVATSGPARQVFRSDGTAAGTFALTTYSDDGRAPHDLTAVGDDLYFAGEDGLFRTDGTVAGTTRVDDPDLYGWDFHDLQAGDGKLFYLGRNQNSRGLFSTDGTAAGTRALTDQYPESYAVLGDVAYFEQYGGIWRPTGDPGDPRYLTGGRDPVAAGDDLYFTYEGDQGEEVYRLGDDGEGELVADVNAGASTSWPRLLTPVGDALYWTADGGTGQAVYRTTGTGATRVTGGDVVAARGSIDGLVALGDGVVFRAGISSDQRRGGGPGGQPVQLWFAGPRGSERLTDLDGVGPPVAAGDQVVFRASDAEHGREVWSTDGTAAGTELVDDIAPGTADGAPYDLTATALGSTVLFPAQADASGEQLWRTPKAKPGEQVVVTTPTTTTTTTSTTPAAPPAAALPASAAPVAAAPSREILPLVTVVKAPAPVARRDGRTRVRTGLVASCPKAGRACRVRIVLTQGKVQVGARSLTILPGKARSLPVTLTRAAARELRTTGELTVKATITIRRAGATSITRTRTLTLTR